MIFVDSNIILRYLTSSSVPRVQTMHDQAAALFDAVKRGAETVTFSEIVLHEVCFILASKHHYNIDPTDIADYLSEIIRLPGLRLPRGERSLFLRAFDIYRANPKLEFADALIAARSERLGIQLATFDRALAQLPFLWVWQQVD